MLLTIASQITPSPAEIEQVTRDIFSRPEFQPEPGWEAWRKAQADRLVDLVHAAATWLHSHPTLLWVVFAVLGLLFMLSLTYLVAILLRAISPEERPSSQQRPGSAARWDTGTGTAQTWDEAVREVRLAVRDGDGYRAIRVLYRLFVAVLDHRGILTFAPWKTNADYLRECPSSIAAYQVLVDISHAYEHIVYAHHAVPLHTISTLLTQVEHDQRDYAA